MVLEAKDLTVRYTSQAVLNKVNFQVEQGQVFALLGGNGAGKSTTLKTFLGAIQPSAGQANVLGQDAYQNRIAIRQTISYLPESVMLYGHLSAIENIQYFLSLAGVSATFEQITEALGKVSLQSEAWREHLSKYSKGMRQKTAIALALLRETPILLLDEPTSGLDPSAIDELNALIGQLARSGTTIMMVTHDVYGACRVADQIALLSQGEVVGRFNAEGDQRINTEQVHRAFTQRKAA